MTRRHKVIQGDCIDSIAYEAGLLPETIWDHPANEALKEKRKNPHILLRGDTVFVPALRPCREDGDTGRWRRFLRRGVPATFRLRLCDNNEPRIEQKYTLVIDKLAFTGATDGTGMLEVKIPPNAKAGTLTVHGAYGDEIYRLALGHVDPADEVTGAQARLNNLGYSAGPVDGDLGPLTASAISDFQRHHKLKKVSGELDDETAALLAAEHEETEDLKPRHDIRQDQVREWGELDPLYDDDAPDDPELEELLSAIEHDDDLEHDEELEDDGLDDDEDGE